MISKDQLKSILSTYFDEEAIEIFLLEKYYKKSVINLYNISKKLK